jgi:uncharacterized membrane protein YhaH (DUF805 family)
MILRDVIELWFGLERRVGRRAYALTGFGLMAFKYGVDALAISQVTGRTWTPLDYLSPLLSSKTPLADASPGLFLALALWTLPFVWIGASMTVRRALDAGLSGWVGLLFFVPALNYALMLLLCALPSAQRLDRGSRPEATARDTRALALAAALGALIGVAMTPSSAFLFGGYAYGLFLGTPFVMGFATAFIFNRGGARSSAATAGAVQLAVLLAGGTLVLFALEGVLCLVMAYPIAAPAALLGGWLGRMIALQSPARAAPLALLLLYLPLLTGLDSARGDPPLREVVSAIEIDATPESVWPHVIGFAELEPPRRWVFQLGIAHPLRARIEGRGQGAVRYCEFSTGAFVEPITAWDEPRRLAFDVVDQPAPLHEWSPYRRVHAPHLQDGLRARRGEFRLARLPGGRTRLEGSTWYELDMFPQPYWTLWSDALIHRIHARVLDHIRALAERPR